MGSVNKYLEGHVSSYAAKLWKLLRTFKVMVLLVYTMYLFYSVLRIRYDSERGYGITQYDDYYFFHFFSNIVTGSKVVILCPMGT